METGQKYFDLCVPYIDNIETMKETISEMLDLGYKTIAIDQEYEYAKGKKADAGDIFPSPVDVSKLKKHFENRVTIFQRLTIIYTEVNIHQDMINSLNLRKFDFLAGMPKNDAALMHCCTTFPGDMVSFSPSVGIRLLINRKAYTIGLQRKLYFEVKYAPMIIDSSIRKDIIKLASNYGTVGNSRRIILTSGATDAFQVRSPHDVANFAFILGLSESQGIDGVNKYCQDLLERSHSRRMGRTIMLIKNGPPFVFSSTETDSSDESDSDDKRNEFFPHTSAERIGSYVSDDDNDDEKRRQMAGEKPSDEEFDEPLPTPKPVNPKSDSPKRKKIKYT